MAILLYKVHVESLTFPYPRDLVDTFPDSQLDDIMALVKTFNLARGSIWSFKLDYRIDNSIEVDPETKILPSF